ncbi:S1C family serine protease [Bailinhaonella thermotolerans]|uniref:PDZ domain-containing protein n=1 Tax=Bailinhaonella thermotolerans TaxID=1070861 RepID=A0A3A4B0J8_9ACTN|nr:trypsin-like peptidase domain-containing protein [Bailinhaonella thermotolerans]RJL33458.1 PDZ domain-containing protein [Bailinhaonella thermotolerans]
MSDETRVPRPDASRGTDETQTDLAQESPTGSEHAGAGDRRPAGGAGAEGERPAGLADERAAGSEDERTEAGADRSAAAAEAGRTEAGAERAGAEAERPTAAYARPDFLPNDTPPLGHQPGQPGRYGQPGLVTAELPHVAPPPAGPVAGPVPPGSGGPGVPSGPGGPGGTAQPGWGWENTGAPAAAQPYGMGGQGGWPPPPGDRLGPARAERRGPSMGTLVALALLIALIAGTAGGLGTYWATRDGSGSNSSFKLPAAPTGTKSRAPESIAGVASKVLPSVVSLDVTGRGEAGSGSGFVIQGGYVVTNNHVVAPADPGGEIKVHFSNGKSSSARIVGRDPKSDIAVVKPDDTFGAPVSTLGNSDDVVVGDPVIAIGSPLGLSGTVTTGIVSALNRPVEAGGEQGGETAYLNAIQTDAAINPGNSGGPLVDASGRVIGVNSAIASLGRSSLGGGQTGSIGLGFAIPVNHVSRVVEQLVTTGKAKTTIIGASLDSRYQGGGARILPESVGGTPPIEPGGPADKAGLKAGDIILEFDGKPVENGNALIVAIRSRNPGEKVQMLVQRGGSEQTVTVTLGAK